MYSITKAQSSGVTHYAMRHRRCFDAVLCGISSASYRHPVGVRGMWLVIQKSGSDHRHTMLPRQSQGRPAINAWKEPQDPLWWIGRACPKCRKSQTTTAVRCRNRTNKDHRREISGRRISRDSLIMAMKRGLSVIGRRLVKLATCRRMDAKNCKPLVW
jgi:hypothetical protein